MNPRPHGHQRNDAPTDLVARDELVERSLPLLSLQRLVTLIGPPGVGKTSLAAELARRVGERWAGRVWWCDVRDARTVQDVSWIIARVTGVEVTAERGVGRALAPRDECLVVLDNCEQVPALGASLAEWSAHAPDVHWLMTSRRPLESAGEEVLRVPALDRQEGAELLASLTRHSRVASWSLESNRGQMEQLVELLDGLPLALELAASRARMLSPSDILRHAKDSLGVLPSRTDDRGPHVSLLTSIEWSWELLSEPAQKMFRRICVFEEELDLDVARAACGLADGTEPDIGSVVDALDELVSHNLIQRIEVDGNTRFRLLQTLRSFGLGKLRETGELEEARERRLKILKSRVDRWVAALEREDLESIWADLHTHADLLRRIFAQTVATHPDFALKILRVLSPYLRMRGPRKLHPELAWKLEPHITMLVDSESRARAYAELSIVGHVMKSPADALRFARLMQEEASAWGDEALHAESLLMLSQALHDAGESSEASKTAEAALRSLPLSGRPHLEFRILHWASTVAFYRGEREVALQRMELARAKTHRLDSVSRARAQHQQGQTYAMLGRLEEAVAELKRAEVLLRAVPDYFSLLWTHLFLTYLELALELDEDASEDARSALKMARRIGVVESVFARCEAACAWTDLFSGQRERAVSRLQKAAFMTSAPEASDDDGEERALLAALHWMEGDVGAALKNQQQALQRTVYPPLKFIRNCFLYGLYNEAGRHEEAAELREKLLGEEADQSPASRAIWSLFSRTRDGAFTLEETERSRLRELIRTSDHGLFIRLAIRIVEERFEETDQPETLVVHPDGRWFELNGEMVDLSRRGPMKLLLVALVRHRLDQQTGEPLNAYELFEEGWPGQQIDPELATARVYNTIKNLRNLGLGDALTSSYHGYQLHPSLQVEWASA